MAAKKKAKAKTTSKRPRKKTARLRAGLKRKQVKRRARVSGQSRVKSGKRKPTKKK